MTAMPWFAERMARSAERPETASVLCLWDRWVTTDAIRSQVGTNPLLQTYGLVPDGVAEFWDAVERVPTSSPKCRCSVSWFDWSRGALAVDHERMFLLRIK